MSKMTTERTNDDETKSSGGISVRLVTHAVWRHPIAFALVIVLAGSAATGVWCFLPVPKMAAAVVFHISEGKTIFANPADGRVDLASYRQTQIALLKSRKTLGAVLAKDEIKNLPMVRAAAPEEVTWLDKALTIDQKSGVEHLRITIEGNNREELLALLDAVAKGYETASFGRDNADKIWRLKELEKALELKEAEIAQDKAKRNEIAKKNLGARDAADLVLRNSRDQTLLLQLTTDRMKHQNDLTLAQFFLAHSNPAPILAVASSLAAKPLAPQGLPADYVPESDFQDFLSGDQRYRALETDLAKARDTLALAETNFQPDSDSVAKAKAKVESLTQELQAHEKKARADFLKRSRNPGFAPPGGRMLPPQDEVKRLEATIKNCDREIAGIHARADAYGEYKDQFEKLQENILHTEKLSSAMDDAIDRLKVEKPTPPRVTVLEEPFIVPGIEGNRRKKYSILAALAVFFAGLVGLIGWEYRSRRVTHADELSTTLGTRLIGTIPPLVPAYGGTATDEAHESLVEAIDTTRIMLTHGSPDGARLRVLMVTSAVSGEGKTTLSGHLAISLTRAGFRTLLIDADMHAPTAHRLFNVREMPGLSELLRGDSGLTEAIRPTPIPGLSVLPAGKWNMATRQTLVGDRWKLLRRELDSQFDFIVIDTSPLLMVSDTMLLAREADGVVLSVMLGVSQMSRVAETVSRLQAIGAELAGVVVSNVQCEVSRRYGSRIKPSPSILPYGEPIPEVAGVDGERV